VEDLGEEETCANVDQLKGSGRVTRRCAQNLWVGRQGTRHPA
jgi:hypothetical protein